MSQNRTTQILSNSNSGYTKVTLNEGSTFPYTHTDWCQGVEVENSDAVNAVTVTITYPDATTISWDVKATQGYTGQFKNFKTINVTTSSTSFQIHLKGVDT